MTRFFVRASAVADGTVTITGADAYHIARALRMATGERITVCDMQKNEYQCVLTHIRDDIVTAEILSSRKNDTELCCRVRLYQSLAKGEKMEYIIQKSVELGANAIIPVASARCIVKLTAAQAEQKRMRWQKIADGAAKQSGRGVLPQILPCMSLPQALADSAANTEQTLFCFEGDGTRSMRSVLAGEHPRSLGIFIGPEGGYDTAEVAGAREAGALLTGLGKRILRCETAPLFALSCLIYQFEL